MNIGIDLDEVVGDSMSALIAFHNGKYGTALTRDDFFSYEFWYVWGGTQEEAVRKMREFFGTDHFTNIDSVFGSLRALTQLKEAGHKIFLITGRENSVIKKTEAWIERHFPDVFEELYFANSYNPAGGRRKKSDICKELGIAILVEDDLIHIKDCSEAGVATLLFDEPWNQGEVPPNARRVFSWDEVVAAIFEKATAAYK